MTAKVLAAREQSAKYLAAANPALVRGFELVATAPAGVRRLRELVLSFAVRGVLVPQISTEGDASDVLSSARAARTEADVGRRARQAALQLGDDSDVGRGELPAGWLWATGADLYRVIRGVSYEKQQARNVAAAGTVPLLRANNIQRTLNFDDSVCVPTGLVAADQILRAGDYVVCMASGSKGLVGKAAPFFEGPTCTFGAFCAAIRPFAVDLAPYLGVFLSSPIYREEVSAESAGIGINNLKSSTLLSLRLPLPPLAEQHRIVARVEELMKLCDALEQSGRLADEQHARLTSTLFDALAASESAHALAENWQRVAEHFDLLLDRPEAIDALEQTTFQLAVRGLLAQQNAKDETAESLIARIQSEKVLNSTRDSPKQGPPVPEPIDGGQPFELPVGWAWARFGQLGEFGRGKSKHRPRNDPRLFVPGAHPLIQTGEVSRAQQFITEVHSYYSNEGLAQSKRWPAGTLCITIAANIADSAILSFDACFPDSVVGFVPAKAIGDALYFLVFMKTARQRLIDFAPATAQKNINLEVLNNVLIPLPPFAEQRRIVARVEELRRLCADLRQQLAQARETQSRLADALVAEVA